MRAAGTRAEHLKRGREGWEKAAEKEREREVQEVAEGVQGSIQPAGAGDVFRPHNEGPVLHHGSPWRVLLILPVTRRILPRSFVHTPKKKHTVKEAFRCFSIVF